MTSLLFVTIALCAIPGIALLLLIRKINAAAGTLPLTAEWIGDLSAERYKPMLRLLDMQELVFLQSQPGFNPRMLSNLRTQRCLLFRDYLRCLCADFGRICAAIKVLMLQSRRDRSDLAATLLRSQVMFACGIVLVHFHIVLYRFGVCGVDVTELVRLFDQMRRELTSLVPAGVTAAA